MIPAGYVMTEAEPGSNILTLNSGSSSLKFGLYRVGSSRTEMLLSGEAESIGDKKAKFYAQDSHENALLSETASIPSQQEAIIRLLGISGVGGDMRRLHEAASTSMHDLPFKCSAIPCASRWPR